MVGLHSVLVVLLIQSAPHAMRPGTREQTQGSVSPEWSASKRRCSARAVLEYWSVVLRKGMKGELRGRREKREERKEEGAGKEQRRGSRRGEGAQERESRGEGGRR